MKNFSYFTHPNYESVSEISSADAIAWAFTNPKEIEKIAFKFDPVGRDEVRANVLYCGLCHSDLQMGRAEWLKDLTYPIVAGHEIIAEVVLVGSNVKHLKRGDKVGFGFIRDNCGTCSSCKNGKENLCSKGKNVFGVDMRFGGFATQIQQCAKWFFKLPENLDLVRAGPLLCAGVTVFTPIKNHLKKGDKTAVIGIGGLGHMAVQYLAKMGHEVTAFNYQLDHQDNIIKLGAKEVVDTTNVNEFSKHLGKYDFIINTVPYGNVIPRMIELCSPQAKFIQVGVPDAKDNLLVPAIPLVFKEVQIIGSNSGGYEDFKFMFEFSIKNNIYPVIEEFQFEDFIKAVDKIYNGKPKFRIVLNVQEYANKNKLH